MIEHVGERCQNVSFDLINEKSKNTAADDSPSPTKVPKLVLSKSLAVSEDCVVVPFEVIYFFMDLH